MTRKRILIILLLLVLLGVGWMLKSILNPSVLQFTPVDSSTDLPRDSVIEIRFSRPMQPESVLERLSISPAVEGEYTWEGAILRFQPTEDWPPGAKVRSTLVSGALTDWGISLDDSYGWSFTVRRTQLAYLYPAGGQADLYALDPISGDIEQLTTVGGVQDFDIYPAGNLIYYSADNNNNGSDLYSLNVITTESKSVLACQQDSCSDVQISPDGTMIAYLRIDQRGQTAVRLLDLVNGEEQRVSPIAHQVRLPQWATNGWLSYYDSTAQAYQIVDLDTDDVISLENQTGELGSWSPTGKHFLGEGV